MQHEDRQALLEFVLDTARRHGATSADALFVSGSSTEVRVRLGQTEQVKQSVSKGVGLRVFFGHRSATTSSSDLQRGALEDLIARTCQAAQVTTEDPHASLPPEELFARATKPAEELDLYDPALEDLDAEQAIARATEAEAAAQGADPRINNSEGAEMSWGVSETHFANTLGVSRHAKRGSAGLWTAPIAEHDGAMERDYWYTSARHLAALAAPAEVGREAARRTLRRLGARKPPTTKAPVIFEWTVASRLLGALAGAVNGGAIYRDASYLAGKLGESIASPLVTVRDDALIPRGPSSKPFDGEGLATGATAVVTAGRLESYLLDVYTARKLGLTTTRNASRGLAGTPSPSATNFWMEEGEGSLADLIAATPRGLLVTELMGFGVNTTTGDYSQGAAGLWIEDGAIAHPVHELTIASTLPQIWANVDRVAADRDPQRGVSAPSFRVAEMTIAGS